MSDISLPLLKAIARQLLAYEAAAGNPAGAKDPAVFRAIEKLRVPLGKLIGIIGFRSLLTRALVLAGDEVPWLHALHIRVDGSLEVPAAKLDSRDVAAADAALMTQLIGLLVIFIGTALTLQLLHEVWPPNPPARRTIRI